MGGGRCAGEEITVQKITEANSNIIKYSPRKCCVYSVCREREIQGEEGVLLEGQIIVGEGEADE